MKNEQNNTHKSKPKSSEPQSLVPGTLCGGYTDDYTVRASPKNSNLEKNKERPPS